MASIIVASIGFFNGVRNPCPPKSVGAAGIRGCRVKMESGEYDPGVRHAMVSCNVFVAVRRCIPDM